MVKKSLEILPMIWCLLHSTKCWLLEVLSCLVLTLSLSKLICWLLGYLSFSLYSSILLLHCFGFVLHQCSFNQHVTCCLFALYKLFESSGCLWLVLGYFNTFEIKVFLESIYWIFCNAKKCNNLERKKNVKLYMNTSQCPTYRYK